MKFHPDVLAAHAEFGGDLEDMQRKYDAGSERPIPAPDAQAVAWQDATGKELHKIILAYQKRDMLAAGGRQAERATNYSIALYTTPVTGEADVERLKAERDAARQLVEQMRALKTQWRNLCLQHEQTILDERSRVEALTAEVGTAIAKLWPNGLGPKNLDELVTFVEEERNCDAEYRAAKAKAEAFEEAAQIADALLAVVDATRAYLPPDGIDAQECLNRILAATDNPKINPIIAQMERGNGHA